jgi:hypothetical protein
MRFTISREQLQEGLAAVAASVPAKTTLSRRRIAGSASPAPTSTSR